MSCVYMHSASSSESLESNTESLLGGNLSLGVISHILHPHPKIPPLSLAAPLKGAILLCPWASFDTSWPSMESNKYKDVVTTTIGNRWSANYLGTSIKDEYNEALRADPKWWTDLQNTVDEIFVVAAKDEILIDSIQEMGKKLQVSIILGSELRNRMLVLYLQNLFSL